MVGSQVSYYKEIKILYLGSHTSYKETYSQMEMAWSIWSHKEIEILYRLQK